MKQMKIGLDLGASRVKVSFVNTKGDIESFFIPNRVLVGSSVGSSGYLVEYNNNVKRIGANKGTPNMAPNKLDYLHLEEIILSVGYKILKLMGCDDEVLTLEIETLLPPTQFFTQGEAFGSKLSKMEVIKGRVNDKEVKVIIADVNVNCEGVALLSILDFNTLAEEVNKVLLVDVGSSTSDLVEVLREDGLWEIGEVDTIDFGGTRMCKDIAKAISKEHGTTFKYDDLEKTMTYTFNNKEYSIFDKVDCLDNVVDDVIVRLNQFGDHRQYKVIFGGDGSELLYRNAKMKAFIPNATILSQEERLYGNSIGALNS